MIIHCQIGVASALQAWHDLLPLYPCFLQAILIAPVFTFENMDLARHKRFCQSQCETGSLS
jgi:hypothetical protein